VPVAGPRPIRRSARNGRPPTCVPKRAAIQAGASSTKRRVAVAGDQPPDGPPVGHGSTLASCMRGRTSTPQYLDAGLRAAISKARSRLSQSTIVKLPRYSLAST
jgi:hypothetical protein